MRFERDCSITATTAMRACFYDLQDKIWRFFIHFHAWENWSQRSRGRRSLTRGPLDARQASRQPAEGFKSGGRREKCFALGVIRMDSLMMGCVYCLFRDIHTMHACLLTAVEDGTRHEVRSPIRSWNGILMRWLLSRRR
jgi:hypothetical protein